MEKIISKKSTKPKTRKVVLMCGIKFSDISLIFEKSVHFVKDYDKNTQERGKRILKYLRKLYGKKKMMDVDHELLADMFVERYAKNKDIEAVLDFHLAQRMIDDFRFLTWNDICTKIKDK